MRVGVIQSNYLPWRGYFDIIASVDLFVFHDDLQYTRGDWRNRNRIKTAGGLKWITVPVRHERTTQLIAETTINYSTRWEKAHLDRFAGNYAKAPHLGDALDLMRQGFSHRELTISGLNVRLITLICSYLGIHTPLRRAEEFGLGGAKTERLVSLLKQVGARCYLSGPAGSAYLDTEAFRREGIGLEYKTYDYAPYPQLWGEFAGAVTVLDLIANTGPQALRHLRSRTPGRVVVPAAG